jgi:hypothetical protein
MLRAKINREDKAATNVLFFNQIKTVIYNYTKENL